MGLVKGGGGGNAQRPVVKEPAKKPVKVNPLGLGASAAPKSGYAGPMAPSGGYAGGGGGLGSSSGGQISPTPPTPPPSVPSLKDFIAGDSVYNQQLSALNKARQDYLTQQGQSRTNYLTNYTGDLNSLRDNRKNALSDLENDFASRGLLQSGLYADNLANTNKDFDKKQSALEAAKAAFLNQLASDFTNFSSEQNLTTTKAKQEAAARRAAQYGL